MMKGLNIILNLEKAATSRENHNDVIDIDILLLYYVS